MKKKIRQQGWWGVRMETLVNEQKVWATGMMSLNENVSDWRKDSGNNEHEESQWKAVKVLEMIEKKKLLISLNGTLRYLWMNFSTKL